MAWNLITSGAVQGSGTSTLTSPSFNGIGADLIVIVVTWSGSGGGTTPAGADSSGNTYSGINISSTTQPQVGVLYTHNPTVTSSMTVGVTPAVEYPCMQYYVYSGSIASGAVLDVSSFNNAGATQPGSVTPSQNNTLLVTGVADESTATDSVTGGFASSAPGFQQAFFRNAINYGGAASTLVQTTAAAVNPTWTSANGASPTNSTIIAAFKPAAGAAPKGSFFPGWIGDIAPIPAAAAAALIRNPIVTRRWLIRPW